MNRYMLLLTGLLVTVNMIGMQSRLSILASNVERLRPAAASTYQDITNLTVEEIVGWQKSENAFICIQPGTYKIVYRGNFYNFSNTSGVGEIRVLQNNNEIDQGVTRSMSYQGAGLGFVRILESIFDTNDALKFQFKASHESIMVDPDGFEFNAQKIR